MLVMNSKQVSVANAHLLLEHFRHGLNTAAPRWPIDGRKLKGGGSGPWRRALLSFPSAFCPLTWGLSPTIALPNSAYLIIRRSRAVSDAMSRLFILNVLHFCRRITIFINLSRLQN
jgi:hypothetical protein